jgi:hypothetical protein
MSGLILVLYCITIAVGLTLTLQRLYKVWWAKFRLHSIFITEGEPLHVHATQNRKRTRLLVTHKQARLVPELVRMLRHLQVSDLIHCAPTVRLFILSTPRFIVV